MNEHFVAIEVGSLYARGRERNMPAAEGSQDGGVKREVRPSVPKPAEPKPGGQTSESKPAQNNFLENIRGFFDIEPDELAVHPKVSFENARLGANIVAAIRREEQVTATSEDVRRVEDDLLKDGRIPANVIHGMDDNEVFAAYPLLLQNTIVEKPKNSDFEYPKADPKRRAEELAANLLIEKAASTDEEQFAPEKVGQYLKVAKKSENGVFEVPRPDVDLADAIKDPNKVAFSSGALDAVKDVLRANGYSDDAINDMSIADVVSTGHRVIQGLRESTAADGEGIKSEKTDDAVEVRSDELSSDRAENAPADSELLHSQLFYEGELKLPGTKDKFLFQIYKKNDGGFAMTKLPTIAYDEKLIKQILTESNIVEGDIELHDWKSKSSEEKEALLREKFNLDTVPGGLAYRPEQWGYINPGHDINTRYGDFVDEMEFRDLIFEKWRGAPPARLAAIENEINSRIQSGEAAWVFSAVQDVEDVRNEIRNDPAAIVAFDTVFSPQQQANLENVRVVLDMQYQQLVQNVGENSVSDIKKIASHELQMLNVNYTTLDTALTQVLRVASSKNDVPGREGFRIWYAFRQAELLKNAAEVLKRTEIQADPLENLKAAEETMRFFEKSKTKEIFSLSREKLVRIIQVVENSEDPRVTAHMKERLRKRFNSFEQLDILLITADESEGSPDKLHPLAVTHDNETWHYFYDRFIAEELTDREGNFYMMDINGQILDINLQSELENSITYQYLVDRWRYNRVRDMMGRDLNQAAPFNQDESWLIQRINEKIAARIPAAAGVTFNNVWNVGGAYDRMGHWQSANDPYNSIRTEALNEWYEERTFLGADGYDPSLNRLRKDVWIDSSVQWHLRNRLQNAGVAPDRINALLGELSDPTRPFDPIQFINNNPATPNPHFNPLISDGDYDLMSTVKRNGYDLAKFKLADTLDRFRVYNRNGMHQDTGWGEDTPYGARLVTNFADWCLNEGQGDPRAVRELIRLIDEEWSGAQSNPDWEGRGQILAQNSQAARFFSMKDTTNTKQVIIPRATALGQEIDRLIIAETTRTQDPRRDVEGYVWTNKIMDGIDPNNPNDVNRDLANINWQEVSKEIKAYPVHDMLDDRQKVLAWYMDTKAGLRGFLLRPFTQEFITMMRNYYSARPDARGYAGAEKFMELYWRLGQHWRDWYGYDDNLTTAQFENDMEVMRNLNLISEERAQRLIEKLFGARPQLDRREAREVLAEGARQTVGSRGWWAGTAFKFTSDVLWPFLRYLATGK